MPRSLSGTNALMTKLGVIVDMGILPSFGNKSFPSLVLIKS